MGFWPFGGGKRQRASESSHTRQLSSQTDPSENVQKLEKANTDKSGSNKAVVKKEEGKSRRLSKIRTASNEKPLRSQTASLENPPSRRTSRNLQPSVEKPLYQHDPTSQSSLGPENFNVVRPPPTLYARRPENDSNVTRRKSSKRKAEDYAREREIKTMSTSPIPIPRRPTSFYNTGPLQRETRDIPGGFNRKLNRSSQVSLPLPQSLPDVIDLRQQNSFKIGTFAALSPRPTIKYDATSASARGKQPQRTQPVPRPPIVEEEEGADRKRINELADDLDAGGLRELMERDRRRREKKKETDRARLQRKLQKRADKQKEEEARKARTEEYVSSASQMAGLGIAESAIGAFRSGENQAGPSGRGTRTEPDPFADQAQPVRRVVSSRNPFDDEKDMDVMHESEPEREPAVPVRSPLRNIRTDASTVSQRPSQAALSPPVSPTPRPMDRQSMSQASILNREQTSEIPESASFDGRASDHSSQKLNSWTAFFRRGTRRKHSSSFQGRSTPSEFSNTSRESFARHGPPPIVTPRTFRRADSNTPQRTMSKFREDLPELPISPPDSRMQSPDTTMPPSAGGLAQALASAHQPQQLVDEVDRSAYTSSSPIPVTSKRQEPEPEQQMELDTPSNTKDVPLSQSLASVDSEASWLSGKPLNRRSGASQRLKGSRSSLGRPMPGGFEGGLDLTRPAESPLAREFSPESAPDTAERDDEKWHQGLGRQPTLIRQASRAKSKEGLLSETPAEQRRESSGDSDDDSPEDADVNEVSLMRARSVEYKGHARQISAGSAKLLDISRRGSQRSEDLLTKMGKTSSHDQLSKS